MLPGSVELHKIEQLLMCMLKLSSLSASDCIALLALILQSMAANISL